MMNGISFNEVHSYHDLNLVLSEVNIPPAVPKTKFIDIRGGDGSIDLTDALCEVRFKDRPCKFTFTVFPYDNFEEKKQEVSNLLNGQRKEIILDKDPDYCWTGRCSVDEYASNKKLNKIVVGAVVAPYKLKNYQTKIIFPAGEAVTKTLQNGRKAVIPVVTCTANATIIFNGNTYTLEPGVYRILGIELHQGGNRITVTSAGEVQFTYQEGDL